MKSFKRLLQVLMLLSHLLLITGSAFAIDKLPDNIAALIGKEVGGFQIVTQDQYDPTFMQIVNEYHYQLKSFVSIDLNADKVDDYVVSVISIKEKKFYVFAMVSDQKNFVLHRLTGPSTLYQSKTCQGFEIKLPGKRGLSKRKYFYYNFEKHPEYLQDPRPKSFWDFTDTKKAEYTKVITIELNSNMICDNEELMFYSSDGFLFTGSKLIKYHVYD